MTKATTAMKQTFRPIKKELIRLTKDVLINNGIKPKAPTHKYVANVTETTWTAGEDATPDRKMRDLMRNNPFVSVTFPEDNQIFSDTKLEEFIETLNANGFIPDDVDVFISPYEDDRSKLPRLVVLFDSEVYAEETGELVDARFTVITTEDIEPAPVVRAPRNPLTLLNR